MIQLPSEVRNLIYSFTVTFNHPIRPRFEYYEIANGFDAPERLYPVLDTALLTVKRQLSREATAILHRTNISIACDAFHLEASQACTQPSKEVCQPNDWDNAMRKPRLTRELINLGEPTRKAVVRDRFHRERLLRLKRLQEDDLYTSMISRIEEIYIRVDWIRPTSPFHVFVPSLSGRQLDKVIPMLKSLHVCLLQRRPSMIGTITLSFQL